MDSAHCILISDIKYMRRHLANLFGVLSLSLLFSYFTRVLCIVVSD